MFVQNKTPLQEFELWVELCQETPLCDLVVLGPFKKNFGPMAAGEFQQVQEWAAGVTEVRVEVHRDTSGVHVYVTPLQTTQGKEARKTRRKARRAAARFKQSAPRASLIFVQGEVVERDGFRDVTRHYDELRREID
jgi:hypothetical protein